MYWIFIIGLFKSVVTQNLHYDCYGAGLMNGNCSSTQKIYPLEVEVGTKERSLNCSMEYTPDLNWTMTQFDMCCRPESGDTCRGKYINVDNPLNTFIFYEYCIGRSACRVLQVPRVDTAYLSCDQTQYYAQTTFMAMEYDCIEESKIGTINTVVSKQSDPGESVYLKGENYELSLGILASVSTQSCSVEASSCESAISIEGLDIRLANDGSACRQNITIVDGDQTTTLDCSSNINFTSFSVQSTSSYLHITFLNSMSSNGGHFWLGFKTNSPETVRLDCPTKAPQNECITTTAETTTTTELTTASTEPVTTNTEPVTTSSQPDTTITESDTTSTESNTSSTLAVTTTTKTKPKASESLDIKVVILPVIGLVVAVIVMIVTWLCWRKNKVACSTSKVEKENRNMGKKNENESNPSDIGGRQIPANDVKTNVEDQKDKKNKKKKKKKRMKKREQQEERNIINDYGRTLQTGGSEESKFDLGPIDPSHEDQRGNGTHSNNAVIIEDEEKNVRPKKKKRRKQCEPDDEIEMVIEGKAEIHVIEENTDVKKKKKKKKKPGGDMTNEDDMDGETDKKSKKKKKRRSRHETNETENSESRTENI